MSKNIDDDMPKEGEELKAMEALIIEIRMAADNPSKQKQLVERLIKISRMNSRRIFAKLKLDR